MRSLSLVTICGLLLAATACSDDSSGSGGEINSQEDVRRLFEAVMPDLVEAFTELANDQSFATSALSSSRDKSSHISSVPCPGGGTLEVDLNTGQATLTNCSVGGVTISATLTLFVFSIGPSAYAANFFGILMVSGSFTGTVEVDSALIEWTVPPTVATTFWDVTVIVNGQMFTVTSGDPGNGMQGSGDPEGCSDARFVLTPTMPADAPPSTKIREVCFHSEGPFPMTGPGECPIYNYSMPPNTDFTEFVDIFYGGTMCDDEFLAEFTEGTDLYIFFGEPQRSPATTGVGPLAIGTYFILGGGENGDFEYFWPTQ